MPTSVADQLLASARELCAELEQLDFAPPVTHVYNPLTYAWEGFEAYTRHYASRGVRAVFMGINPGPWGMAQTGVPFGDPGMVRNWLNIEAGIGRPTIEHPKRPVEGFACRRSEVSGTRFWGWARDRFGTPDRFFEQFYVFNYCPLTFMEESGRNRTPDKLRKPEREALFAACDAALRRNITAVAPTYLVAIGAFAEGRATEALDGMGIEVVRVLHPSPANPAASSGWGRLAEAQLTDAGVLSGT